MPVDVSGTLRQALSRLETEKARIDHQIAAIRLALKGAQSTNAAAPAPARIGPGKRGRKRMSATQRKAVGARMKAYWAKQRKSSAKKGGAAKAK